MDRLPLLIQGFDLPDVAAGGNIGDRFVLEKHRGRTIYIDPMLNESNAAVLDCNITVALGGKTVLENSTLYEHDFAAWPRAYRLTECDAGPGQTLSVTLDNPNAFVAVSSNLHVYYENPYLNPKFLAAFNASKVNLKHKDYIQNNIAGAKQVQNKFDLPKERGDIIGVQIVVHSNGITPLYQSRISILVNGDKILDNAGLLLGAYQCGRPMLTLPCFIERASTVEILVDNNGATDFYAGARFYFAPDEYELPI